MARPQHDWSRDADLFIVFFVLPLVAIGAGLLTLVLAYWTVGPPGL
jgi:hypothetical protein